MRASAGRLQLVVTLPPWVRCRWTVHQTYSSAGRLPVGRQSELFPGQFHSLIADLQFAVFPFLHHYFSSRPRIALALTFDLQRATSVANDPVITYDSFLFQTEHCP